MDCRILILFIMAIYINMDRGDFLTKELLRDKEECTFLDGILLYQVSNVRVLISISPTIKTTFH
jgi:hypothetical protein